MTDLALRQTRSADFEEAAARNRSPLGDFPLPIQTTSAKPV
jgi:hypothetical protein